MTRSDDFSRPAPPGATMKRPASCLLPPASCILLAILLLASLLRFYRLDAQSFWNDEGNSARIAERTVSLILEGAAADIHPPGYYLLLHAWRALAGQSEFALRSLSVAAGLVLVVFTYLLGRRLFGKTTGLLAAFLAALSPFAIYYSQEARMYALMAVLSVASTYLLVRLLTNCKSQIGKSANRQISKSQIAIRHSPFAIRQSPIRRFVNSPILHSPFSILLAYVLTCTAGLYTQYAFAFILLVHNAIFGLWWLAVARRSKDRWRWLAMWAGAQVAIVALYLPWLPVALRSVTGWPSAEEAPVLGRALLDVLRVLSVGVTLPLEEATAALIGAGALLLVGLWPRPEGSSPEGPDIAGGRWFSVAIIALYLLLPVALLFTFDLYKPAWLKFLVVVLPPFHILIAHGIQNLAQFTRAKVQDARCKKQEASRVLHLASCILLLGIYLTTTFQSLRNLYFDPACARDDYRQIAADVAALARPGDGIVLNAPNQWEVFTYYYPDRDVHPAPYHPAPDEAQAFLAPLAGRYRRLHVLYWGDAESDPGRLVETWLAAHTYPTADRWYGRVRLATYGIASLPEDPAVALDARFGAEIRLRGYALAGERFAPGDVLPVTLFWETQVPVAERYKVTVQLLDGAGQLATQRDAEPGAGLAPTTAWQPGQVFADHYGVPLPADLAPGRYTLIVGLYHVAIGQRLPVMLEGQPVGDHLVLTGVEVAQ